MLLGVLPGHLQDRWTLTTELLSNRSGSQASHARPRPACRRELFGHFVFLSIAIHCQHKQINEAFHIKSGFPDPLEVRCVWCVSPTSPNTQHMQTSLSLTAFQRGLRDNSRSACCRHSDQLPSTYQTLSERNTQTRLHSSVTTPDTFFKNNWRQNSRVVWSSAPQWET